MWDPGQSRLVGLVESSKEKPKELFCVRIEQWLEAVCRDLPEFTDEVRAVLATAG